MFGPLVRGKIVTLRPPTKDDLPHFIEWLADMDVTRYLGRRSPPSTESEEDWYKRMGEDEHHVVWVMEVGGKAVGVTGIHGIDWINSHATTGIMIGDKEHWRKGVASEAMALRTRYAFRELNLHKLKSSAFMKNEGSRRALQKAGYRQSGVQREEMFREGAWHDMWVAEVLRSEWESEHTDDGPRRS